MKITYVEFSHTQVELKGKKYSFTSFISIKQEGTISARKKAEALFKHETPNSRPKPSPKYRG